MLLTFYKKKWEHLCNFFKERWFWEKGKKKVFIVKSTWSITPLPTIIEIELEWEVVRENMLS